MEVSIGAGVGAAVTTATATANANATPPQPPQHPQHPTTTPIATNKSVELKRKIREIEYVFIKRSHANIFIGKRFITTKVGSF